MQRRMIAFASHHTAENSGLVSIFSSHHHIHNSRPGVFNLKQISPCTISGMHNTLKTKFKILCIQHPQKRNLKIDLIIFLKHIPISATPPIWSFWKVGSVQVQVAKSRCKLHLHRIFTSWTLPFDGQGVKNPFEGHNATLTMEVAPRKSQEGQGSESELCRNSLSAHLGRNCQCVVMLMR